MGDDVNLEAALKLAIELRENLQTEPRHGSVLLGIKEACASFLLPLNRTAGAKAAMVPRCCRPRLRTFPPRIRSGRGCSRPPQSAGWRSMYPRLNRVGFRGAPCELRCFADRQTQGNGFPQPCPKGGPRQ